MEELFDITEQLGRLAQQRLRLPPEVIYRLPISMQFVQDLHELLDLPWPGRPRHLTGSYYKRWRVMADLRRLRICPELTVYEERG